MNIKFRLTALNFLQFFVWGSYLTTLGDYMWGTLHFPGEKIGLVFMTLGIASIFMPTILGIIADRWINAEKVLGISHLAGAAALYFASTTTQPSSMFYAMLLVCICYMPTIALCNTVSYVVLQKNGANAQKDFTPIRVWGTIGFICAMWIIDLLHWTGSPNQLIFAAAASIIMGLYSFTIQPCKPENTNTSKSLSSTLGLDAFVLFKDSKMSVFFIFSMLLGAALQITNQWGVPFIRHFGDIDVYKNTAGVQHPNILVSISQISETLFILTIPFFLKKFGIKKVMLISIFAWVLRFALFGIGNPGTGLPLLVLSMIVYGMAFDFFNISGSLFVEKEAPHKIRASAQGLFMLMTNGLGSMIGSFGSGWVVQHFTVENTTDWATVWYIFAGYALIIGLIFPFVFKYKHDTENLAPPLH